VFDHVGVTTWDGAGAGGIFELRPPVESSDLDEKVFPLHRRGTPVYLESGLRVNVASFTYFPPTEREGSTARTGGQALALPREEEGAG
jgi:hypothetical protein